MSRLTVLVPFVLAVLLVACGGDDDDDGDAADAGTTATSAPEASPRPTAAEDKPTEEPAPAGVTDEPVRFETSDGVTIVGHLYSGGGPKRKVAVLAHERPRDQTAWTPFAQKLAAAGIDALTFDFRGYGETGGDRNISLLDRDLEAAARFIRSRDYPEVYLFGASMGGTAALKVASRLDLAGVVTLSSPPVVEELDARQDVANVAEPKLFVAGAQDEGGAYAAAVEAFMAAAPDPKQSIIYEESAHGTALLETDSGADLEEALFAFLEAN